MRIAYGCYWNAYVDDGVSAKITLQERHWREHGHETRIFCLTPRSEGDKPPVVRGELFPFEGGRERVAETRALTRAIANYAPDLVYLRYDIFIPPPARLLHDFTSAVEVNTDDRREYRLRGHHVRIYNALNRRLVLSAVDGLVCVTRELADRAASLGKSTAVITNGVDRAATARTAPVRSTRVRAALLVGSLNQWHGLDKVVRLAHLLPEWDFVLIGLGSDGAPAPLPANVEVHGLLTRAEYAPLLAACDVGIGPLALHRKGLEEASALKVREYLAHGLPVMIAHTDTDFADASPWFLLRLENNEQNIEAGREAIRRFGERMRGRRVAWQEVAPSISAAAKEAARLEFFERLLERSPKRRHPSAISR